MGKTIVVGLIGLSIILVGCGGRQAHPILVEQDGDTYKSCDQLRLEIASLKIQYKEKMDEYIAKEMIDMGLAAGGAFVGVPLLFIDMKDAEKVEAKAIKHRIEYLKSIAESKDCDFVKQEEEVAPPS